MGRAVCHAASRVPGGRLARWTTVRVGTTAASTRPHKVQQRATARRAVVASSIGNALEWLRHHRLLVPRGGHLQLFFESESRGQGHGHPPDPGHITRCLLIRPIGALVLGSYADHHGRRPGAHAHHRAHDAGHAHHHARGPHRGHDRSAAALLILVARLHPGLLRGRRVGTATAFLVENARTSAPSTATWQVATQVCPCYPGLPRSASACTPSWRGGPVLVGGWPACCWASALGRGALYIRLRMDDPDSRRCSKRGRGRRRPPARGRGSAAGDDDAAPARGAPAPKTIVHSAGRWLTTSGVVGAASMSVYTILLVRVLPSRTWTCPRGRRTWEGSWPVS
ncbi:hypothetical protein QJS66_15095 [Kocuria rhizophila]|nr:hypothetical protein QJS66_15095 [Kocuria rhizophila]